MVSYASRIIGRGTTGTSSGVVMGPGLGVELDTHAQITLFHLATVMNTLVQNSASLVRLLRTHFMEEFRQVLCCVYSCYMWYMSIIIHSLFAYSTRSFIKPKP